MPKQFFDEYPGIFVEYDADDQRTFLDFVKSVLSDMSKLPIGLQLLREFAPGDGKPTWGPDNNNCTLLIRPPTNVSAKTTDTMQTLKAHGRGVAAVGQKHAQKIIAWWPGSENTSLRKGMKELPKSWTNHTINLEAVSKSGERKPLKFLYHGHNETFAIALIHEMIHAYNGIKGEELEDQAQEEAQTVGLFHYFDRPYTENKFRASLGMKPRDDYKSFPHLGQDVNVVDHLQPFCARNSVRFKA
jgi:Effector protein